MKKRCFILIPLLLVFEGCSSKEHDFRNVDWGMTEEEVKENEKESLEEESYENGTKKLVYKTKLDDAFYADLIYSFDTSDKLTDVFCTISKEDNPGKEIYEITDFYYYKFCKLYGEVKNPKYNIWFTKNTTYSYGEFKWGVAIMVYPYDEVFEKRIKEDAMN